MSWTVLLVAAMVLLYLLGRHVLPGPPSLAPRRYLDWARSQPPQLVVFGVLRLLALGMGWYLLALTAATTAARVLGSVRAAGWVRRLALPALRPLLAAVLGLSIGAGVLATPAAASEGSSGGPVMVRLPDTPSGGSSQSAPGGKGDESGAPVHGGSNSAASELTIPRGPARAGPGGAGASPGHSSGHGTGSPAAPTTSATIGKTDGAANPATGGPSAQAPAQGVGSTAGTSDAGPASGGAPEAGGSGRGAGLPANSTTAPATTGTSGKAASGQRTTAGSSSESSGGAASPGATAAGAPGGTWTTEAGDSLWTIAARALQSTGGPVTDAQIAPYWSLVVQANRERLANPADADLIYPGQVFVLPSLPSP